MFTFDLDTDKPTPMVVWGIKKYEKEPWDGGWSGPYEYRLHIPLGAHISYYWNKLWGR